ncbi:MAG: hypothetical protein ACXVCV_25125, partial [Polyangia bacterium]
ARFRKLNRHALEANGFGADAVRVEGGALVAGDARAPACLDEFAARSRRSHLALEHPSGR